MTELLTISVRNEADYDVVAAIGEIDLSTSGLLAEALENLNGASGVVVDLTSCTFIDSSGLGVLVRYAAEAAKVDKRLRVRVNEQSRRIFDLTNLAEALGVEAV